MGLNIPEKILIVLEELESAGFEAFLVGGCVRDLLRGIEPKDWDITTKAKPKEILKVFPDGKYENDFGTVILPEKYIDSTQLSVSSSQIYKRRVVNKNKKESQKQNNSGPITDNREPNIEITTYRIESTYSDNRRPDEVRFAKTLEEDLGRRDFTVNAMAMRVESRKSKVESNSFQVDQIAPEEVDIKGVGYELQVTDYKIIDLFSGWQDIKNKVIRAVGDANERFNEDALRMMRAVRFASQLSSGDNLEFLKERKGEGNQNQEVEYQMLISKRQEVSDKIQINHKKQELNNKQVVKNKTQGGNRKSIDNKNKNLKNLINSMVVGSENFQKPHLTRASLEQRNGFKNFRWWIGENTFQAIKDNAHLLKNISPERIRDEFQKIVLSDRPAWGVELLVETDLMKYIIPEIYKTIGVRQNRHHYNGPFNTVYKHMLAALKTCPSKKLEVRLAAFFHDIGKPQSKRGHGYNSTFYGHEYIGARITKEIMERLKFPRKVIDKTVLLVKNHMFYYNTDEVGEKGVRKVIRKVGLENINDLIDVRIGDRLGSGVAKAVPYKLRHFKYMVEKVSKDPISVKDLKINGDILLADYNFKPGPQMGAILEVLLAEVLDEPKLNNIGYLSKRAIELQKENLEDLRKIAKDKIEKEKQKEEAQVKGKYWVK